MKTISYLIILVTFVSFSGCQKLSMTGPASVSGHVYEHGTTVPASGAWVYLISDAHNSPGALGQKVVEAVQTDATGVYNFNYNSEAGTSYNIYVKYTGSKEYGGSIPDYVWLKDISMRNVNIGLTTKANFTFRMIDTGTSTHLEYFEVLSTLRLTNINKDTSFVGHLPAYVPFNLHFYYLNVGASKITEYQPPPFYAAKGDTLHYTVYF